MAIGYVPLPAPEIRNAMLDLSSLNEAADQWNRNRQQNAMMEYRRERDAVDDKRADARLGLERDRFGYQKSRDTIEDQRANERLGIERDRFGMQKETFQAEIGRASCRERV